MLKAGAPCRSSHCNVEESWLTASSDSRRWRCTRGRSPTPPLARALYRSTRLGQEIPAGLYTAVAQVLAYIFQINNAAKFGYREPDPPTPVVDESQY